MKKISLLVFLILAGCASAPQKFPSADKKLSVCSFIENGNEFQKEFATFAWSDFSDEVMVMKDYINIAKLIKTTKDHHVVIDLYLGSNNSSLEELRAGKLKGWQFLSRETYEVGETAITGPAAPKNCLNACNYLFIVDKAESAEKMTEACMTKFNKDYTINTPNIHHLQDLLE